MPCAQLCPTICNPMDSCQAPLFMEFSRQEYWSGLPCPSPGDLPAPGNESVPPTLQVDSLLAEPSGKPKEGGGKIRQEWNSGICVCVCVCVLVIQSCPTLCDTMDCSPSGSSVHGILQARVLVQVAIPFSRGSY